MKLLYLRILYRCIASKYRFLNRLYRFIARKICLYRQKCRFIAQHLTNFIASSVHENCCLVFSIASSVTKILANIIVSLYSIFFSKIVYLYRFKRYIFENRCPPLLTALVFRSFLQFYRAFYFCERYSTAYFSGCVFLHCLHVHGHTRLTLSTVPCYA